MSNITQLVGGWVRWMCGWVAHEYKHDNFNCKWLSPLGEWVDGSVVGEVTVDHESSNRIKLSQLFKSHSIFSDLQHPQV